MSPYRAADGMHPVAGYYDRVAPAYRDGSSFAARRGVDGADAVRAQLDRLARH